MPRLTRVLVSALLALLAVAGPATAHIAGPPTPLAAVTVAEVDALVPILSAAPAPPALQWYLPAALALVALAAWRRPRRVLALSLCLVLSVFAFENALHSVHHGFDPKQQEECAVAAVSAQLSGVQVDGVALASAAPLVLGPVDSLRPAFAPSRFLSPDQGRAPPSSVV